MKQIKVILLVFIIIYSNSILGQISNLKNYQEKINKSELLLIKGQKEEALSSYYSILTTSKGNFCKDIYNAMLLSTELSKIDTFFLFLNLLKTKGLDNKYINCLDEFKIYHTNKKWTKFENENNNSNINKKLRSKIDSLDLTDQLFRIKEGSYNIYGDTINKIDSMNLYYIYSLLYSNNFPGEDEIGVRSITSDQGYDIVLHHYTQRTSLKKNSNLPKITPILVNLVLQGKILPNKCALWLEMQQSDFTAGISDICNFRINGVSTNFYTPKYTYETKLLLNEYRKWLYMDSYEEYLDKFLFKIKNPETKYRFDIIINTLEADENMFKYISNIMTELK